MACATIKHARETATLSKIHGTLSATKFPTIIGATHRNRILANWRRNCQKTASNSTRYEACTPIPAHFRINHESAILELVATLEPMIRIELMTSPLPREC